MSLLKSKYNQIYNPKKSVFIGGTGRCGTSIMRKIISTDNRAVYLNFAINLFIEIDGIISTKKNLNFYSTPYDETVIIKRFVNFYNHLGRKEVNLMDQKLNLKKKNIHKISFNNWELSKYIKSYNEILKNFLRDINLKSFNGNYYRNEGNKSSINFIENKKKIKNSFKKMTSAIVDGMAKKQNKSNNFFYLDDSTWNHLNFLELSKLFHKPYLIHIYRDPRDVILSFLKQRWAPNNIYACISFYKKLMNEWFEFKKLIKNKNFIEIKFENFVFNPKKEIKNISNLLNYNLKCDYNEIKFEKSNISNWKKNFKKKEIEVLNNELQLYLKYYNYE